MKKLIALTLSVLMLAAAFAMAIPATAKALPSEYMELEYVECDGTQYIDTGIAVNSKICLEVDFQVIDPIYPGKGGSAGIVGAYVGGADKTGRFQIAYSREKDYITMGMGALLVNTPDIIPKDTNRHQAKLDAIAGTFTFDDKIVGQMNPAELNINDTNPNLCNFLIGAANFSKTTEYVTSYGIGVTRYYKVTFYLDGAPLAEFVPAVRKADSMCGFYDIIRDKFYLNDLFEDVSWVADPAVVTTAAETTKAPQPETTVAETKAPETKAPETKAPETEAPAATEAEAAGTEAPAATEAPAGKSGCGSSLAALSVVLCSVLGCAILKKKD